MASARVASSGMISMVYTSHPMADRTAAWYPEPAPISRTLSPGPTPRASLIIATMNGWEIVCPYPMGSGWSPYATSLLSSGTKRWRGTVRIASSTFGSVMPRVSI